MIKPLPDFSNRLTNYYNLEELDSIIAQLEKYGAKAGKDFVFKEQSGKYAVYLNYQAYQVEESLSSRKEPRRK